MQVLPKVEIRILIADDHAIFRGGLRRLLETESGFVIVGEAADGSEAVGMAEKLKPDILLLDLAMPRVSGLETLRQLNRSQVPVRTLLLTANIKEADVIQALQLGARGLVLKQSQPEILIKSIRAVYAGEFWVEGETLSTAAATEKPPSTFGLTSRELEIISEIKAGKSNKDIARTFSISEDTVKRHLSNIFNKLGVSSRLELAVFAGSHDLG